LSRPIHSKLKERFGLALANLFKIILMFRYCPLLEQCQALTEQRNYFKLQFIMLKYFNI